MKKWLITGAVILMVAFGASLVFAAAPDASNGDKVTFDVDQMINACKQTLDQFVKDGTMTPDQGKSMNDHMNTMAPFMRDMMGGRSTAENPGMMGNGQMGPQGGMGQGTSNQGMPCFDNNK
jgi:hypothetical protein